MQLCPWNQWLGSRDACCPSVLCVKVAEITGRYAELALAPGYTKERTIDYFKSARVLCAAVAVAASVVVAVPAYAEDDTVLSALQDAQPEVLADVATSTTSTTSDAIVLSTSQARVAVPVDPADGIDLSSSGGSIALGLPFANEAADAAVEAPGIVSFDNGNGSQTVPVVKTDGSVQITTVISDPHAPSSYAYPLVLPAGASVALDRDGAVVISAADGNFIAGIAPAWAKDADGNDVATRYELAGSTVTQIVDLSSSGIAFPVVADPWTGPAFVDYTTWVSRDARGLTLEVHPTPWGRVGVGSAFWSAYWSELMSKTKTRNSLANTKDMEAQLTATFGSHN